MDNLSSDKKIMKVRDAMVKHGEKAFALFEKDEFAKATTEYARAIELARELEENSQLALFIVYLAHSKVQLGEIEEPKSLLSEAIDLAKSEANPAILCSAKLALAEIYRDTGLSPFATAEFLDAYDLGFHLEDASIQELALSNLGQLYLERGWSEQALACYRQILHSLEELENKPAIMGSIGLCMAELGKFEEAINFYRTACLEAELEGDLVSMATCIGSEGNVLFEMKSYDRALQCYEKAKKLSEKADDKARQAAWLGNIGTTLLKLGSPEKALEKLNEAEAVAKDLGDVHSQAAHLDSIGDCLVEQGNLDEAKIKYEEALALSKSIRDRLGERIYLTNLGLVYQRMGQMQPAFEYLGQAVDIFDEQRATICADDLKTSFADRGQDLYKDMVNLCLSMDKRVEALEFIGRAKSRALLDLLSNSPIDLSTLADDGDKSLRKLIRREKELRSQIDHLERVIWQGPSEQESGSRGTTIGGEDTKQVYSEWRQIVNQLKVSHPNYATLVSADTLDFAAIKDLWNQESKQLDEKTCIVEFYTTDEFLMCLAVTAASSEPHLSMISDQAQLEMLLIDIETFLEMSATEGWEVPKSLCKRLYDALLGPVLNDLPDTIERLVIVPHGNLFHLPFAALYSGEKYLCEDFVLSYVPSLTLIPVLNQSSSLEQTANSVSQAKDRYLVSAISDYSATRKNGLVLSSNLRSSAGLDDLNYTLEEANSIVKLSEDQVGEATLLTNHQVKETFPNLFGEYAVVHFAGHAVFNSEEPMASGLVLSDGTILTAASILERRSLRTQCGRLLVLSACQTGVNKVTAGGEVLGLARALIYAGMPNLVLTLWEVADRSTSDLMKLFHECWQSENLSIGQALKKVQCHAIKSGLPIHAWAPFIHFGID